MRVGIGYDVHRLAEEHSLVLGGVSIPHDRGLVGHSDADVLLHAIADALLGAAALGDLGVFFPDTDAKWEGADSQVLLREVAQAVREGGFEPHNVDATLVLERPKLRPYVHPMRENVSTCLDLPIDAVSVKATTNESLGPVGEENGAVAHAVCTLRSR